MWWDQMEGTTILGDGLSEGKAGFIVQDMYHRPVVGVAQARMDVSVCGDTVDIMFVGEGAD